MNQVIQLVTFLSLIWSSRFASMFKYHVLSMSFYPLFCQVPPNKTHMASRNITMFNRRYIFIHGCVSSVIHSFSWASSRPGTVPSPGTCRNHALHDRAIWIFSSSKGGALAVRIFHGNITSTWCISWVVPLPSNSGKWRFIGIPY